MIPQRETSGIPPGAYAVPRVSEPRYYLHVGSGKFPVGEIPHTAHRPHAIPACITLTIDTGRWYLGQRG